MSRSKARNRLTGNLGEDIAVKYLKDRGYLIMERNYWRKWGELDIVSRETAGKVHFIEVKTVSYETKAELHRAVSYGTWRPEEQVHQFKLHQIYKALETWITDNNYGGSWQIDVLAIRIVPRESFATVNFIENIVN